MPSTTLQLLESDLIRLPKDLVEFELTHFTRRSFDAFQTAIAKLDDAVGDEIRLKRTAIFTLCQSILDAVTAVYEDGMDSAVAAIGPGLEAVRADLVTIARQNEDTVLRGQSLYRVRDAKGKTLSQPIELFHLPFELRHLAPAVRYSAGGAPCLYLSNSIYTCWQECRLPRISECAKDRLQTIYASRFEFTRPASLLDFCFPPWALADAVRSLEQPMIPELAGLQAMNSPIGPDEAARTRYLACWLAIWPLLMAVSLRSGSVDSPKAPKPEYVIPQLLMVWVQRSLNFDGIRYFSTRELPGNNSNDYAIDYAFPVKTSMASGHCTALAQLFLGTPPVGFGRVADAEIPTKLSEEDWSRAESKARRYMIVDEGGIQHYYGTTYCDMEYVLDFLAPQGLAASREASA